MTVAAGKAMPEHLGAGQRHAENGRVVGPLTRTDFVRYAGAGGDFNPVHHDDPYAQRLGFPSVFAMGLFAAGVLAAEVADLVAPEPLRTFAIRFVAPIWPGDTLTLMVAPVGDGQAEVAVLVDGAPRIQGEATFGDAVTLQDHDADLVTDERLRKMLDTALPTVEMTVERGKQVEFARAIHAPTVFRDVGMARAAGYPGLPAVPTFTASAALWDDGDASAMPIAVGLDLARVVHGEQRYRFHRPLFAGDRLRGLRRVSAVATKTTRSGGVMTLVTVTTDFLDDIGFTVLTEEMLMIERPART